jgi:hypothetical protein
MLSMVCGLNDLTSSFGLELASDPVSAIFGPSRIVLV